MPQQDKTGPIGQGSMTGRGLGPCRGWFGGRRRFGLGFGGGFQPIQFSEADTLYPKGHEKGTSEKKILQEELKEIEIEKKEIEGRLKELK